MLLSYYGTFTSFHPSTVAFQGILPGKGQQVKPEKKEPKFTVKARKGADVNEGTIQIQEPKVKILRVPRKVQLPEPKWEEVPTELDYALAEDRFHVRATQTLS